jgi:hypothetical protein
VRKIIYAGGSFITSDAVADALLEYAAALANANRAATIHVPSELAHDQPSDVSVLVGPASQLMAEEVESEGPDPDGGEFVNTVGVRIRQLERSYTHYDAGSTIDWDI